MHLSCISPSQSSLLGASEPSLVLFHASIQVAAAVRGAVSLPLCERGSPVKENTANVASYNIEVFKTLKTSIGERLSWCRSPGQHVRSDMNNMARMHLLSALGGNTAVLI